MKLLPLGITNKFVLLSLTRNFQRFRDSAIQQIKKTPISRLVDSSIKMIFRSTIQIPKAKQTITHQQGVLCMGSCFASNIANKLTENGFDACNPFGALYNPISIAQGIQYAIQGTPVQQTDLFL